MLVLVLQPMTGSFFFTILLLITLALNFFPCQLIYQSVSAFSPIVNPINCAWGQKAFTHYLGCKKPDWEVTSKQYTKITDNYAPEAP